MTNNRKYIIFQCYGDKNIFFECTYALLSLSKIMLLFPVRDLEIWIYTDNKEWFTTFKNCNLPLFFKEIDENVLYNWRGEINFVHRIKIEILKDFVGNNVGNIFYSDTDVLFKNDINIVFQNIDQDTLYMHTMEGYINESKNPVIKKLNDFLDKENLKDENNNSLNEKAMWNAGMLGFNTNYSLLLDKVLVFTDNTYKKYPKHVIEQFSFSVYFQQTGNIKSAAPYIIHYWNVKEMRILLASFFLFFKDSDWNELIKYSTLIDVSVLMQEKMNFYSNRSIVAKIQKKHWLPILPNWDKLLKQL